MLATLLYAAAASGVSDPAPGAAPHVRARADLAQYFGTEDYPWPALLRSEQGNVRFRVAIDREGRVTDCSITQSSGSQALDESTCRLMRERVHYAPARDADGNAVADSAAALITWQLPPEPVMSARARANLASYVQNNDYPVLALNRGEQGTVGFALVISPEGRVAHCEVVHSSGSPTLDARTCEIMVNRARFQAARDVEGNPVGDVVQSRINWRLMR